MERHRGIGPRLVGPPGRERVAIQRLGAREVSGETRQTREVDEIRRRDLIATIVAIEHERAVELPPRFLEIAEPLSQQAEIVVVGGAAPRVADAVAQRERMDVVCARRREVAAFFARTG